MALIDRDEMARRLRALPTLERLLPALEGIESVHLVGGAVRDILLERRPLDVDLVVEGDGPAVAAELARRLDGTVLVHERFATATVTAPNATFDVAAARTESYARPGALPQVAPGTLEEDLLRRDFTVHAIAAALTESALGDLHAAPHALEDLESRTLRVLHEGSFLDDPTRLLRLVRYASRLEFTVDAETARRAREAIAAGAPATVSAARIGEELRPLLGQRSVIAALTHARELGLLTALHPDIALDPPFAEMALAHLPPDGRADIVVLASCCATFGREALRDWLGAMEYEAGERERIVAAALDAPQLAVALAAAPTPSQVAAAARGHAAEEIAVAAALGAARPAAAWLGELRNVELEISGDDLLRAGVAQGPAIGHALAATLAKKLDGELSGADAELQAALEATRATGPG